MPDEEVTASRLLILEYERVKDEQRVRIGFRDNLLYVTLAAMAAVVAATLPSRQGPVLILLLPPVTVILGWTYLVNDQKISAIGQYVRTELGPRLAALSGAPGPVFAWENAHRSDPHRRSRKLLQSAVDLLTFIVLPAAGLAVFWSTGDAGPVTLAVSIVEAALLLLLAIQIVTYADTAGEN